MIKSKKVNEHIEVLSLLDSVNIVFYKFSKNLELLIMLNNEVIFYRKSVWIKVVRVKEKWYLRSMVLYLIKCKELF